MANRRSRQGSKLRTRESLARGHPRVLVNSRSRAGAAPRPRRPVRPTLCAGCGHRRYYAIARPSRGFPGDIGCYTLASIGAVDTVLHGGGSQAAASITLRPGRASFPVVATIGDSTFFHSASGAGERRLQNARISCHLDNATSMTGHSRRHSSDHRVGSGTAVFIPTSSGPWRPFSEVDARRPGHDRDSPGSDRTAGWR